MSWMSFLLESLICQRWFCPKLGCRIDAAATKMGRGNEEKCIVSVILFKIYFTFPRVKYFIAFPTTAQETSEFK